MLAQQPAMMGKVLKIVYRTLATHLIKKAGFNNRTAHTGAVTLIQRFGSALNLNIHFHILFLDGVYALDEHGIMRFHRVKAPTIGELNTLVHQLSHRVARFLEKKGWLQRDAENTYLLFDSTEDDALSQLQGHSIAYRIAMGLHQGRKVLTLQSLPPSKVYHRGWIRPGSLIEYLNKLVFPCMPG